MLYEFQNKLGGNFIYWSNSCGDLHYNGEYDIEKIEDLPQELQRAFTELWCKGVYGVNCYLVEFNGRYGISFEAGYNQCYADDLGMELNKLNEIAKGKAVECSNKYPEYDIIFQKETTESVVMIVMDWDIEYKKFNEIGKYFEDVACEMCNSTDGEMRSCTPLQRCVLLYDDNWIVDVEEDIKGSKDFFCDYCGKKINENDFVLQHEYGKYYCSYEHLVKGAFFGHYKRIKL